MDLKNCSDANLIAKTETLVREEREILTAILHHLREIDRRRLFAALGYKSLFDFAVRRLNYSEDQAYRRIAAMRLLKEIPEVECRINSGELSLTHIGLAQSFFRQEGKAKEFTKSEKLELLTEIGGKSVREAEKITVAKASVQSPPAETVKLVAGDRVELRFSVKSDVHVKVEKLKGLLAHKNPHLSMEELFESLCDLGIATWSQSAAPKKRRSKSGEAEVRRQVFRKAEEKCESCGSRYALEVDHIFPVAKGGPSTIENLRLLCRNCNQRAAIEHFGINKMASFIEL